MSHHLVRCPYCTRRFNITGIAAGTRLRCGGCQAVLTVPDAPAFRPVAPFPVKAAVLSGAAAVLLVAAVVGMWPSDAPLEEPPAVEGSHPTAMRELPPDPEPPSIGGTISPPDAPPIAPPVASWDLRYQAAEAVVFNEFRSRMVTHDEVRPYLVVVEKSKGYHAYDVAIDTARKLRALHETFTRDFGKPLELESVDEPLVVVVFNSRESFDAYCLRTEKQRLSPQIKGIYQYTNRRIVLYHGADAPSVVLFHEGVHQLVDHYVRRAGATGPRTYWFQEGLGTYFEGFGGGADDSDPGVSRERLWIIKQALLRDRSSFISLGVLVGMTVDEFWAWYDQGLQNEPEETARKAQLYYAESWAFVHFLCSRGGKYRRAFEEFFLSELSDGQAPRADRKERFEKIVRDRLDMDLAHLEDEFITYVLNLK